jgi:hypothetical protein
VVLIVVFGVIFFVRNSAPSVTLSMDDLATQITRGNVSSLQISDACIYVSYRDSQTAGCVQRKDSRPVIQQLKELGVSDEAIAKLAIGDVPPPNPVVMLPVIAFVAVLVASRCWEPPNGCGSG